MTPNLPTGPDSATIAIIGEALGRDEERTNQNFVGYAGRLLTKLTAAVGIDRRTVWIHNRYPMRPEGNNLKTLDPADVAFWTADLEMKLAMLPNLRLIVPVGAFALEGLLGKKYSSITKYRGSLLSYTDMCGRRLKVLPTLHTAYVLRVPALYKRALADWTKIVIESLDPEVRLPERTHFTSPALTDIAAFLDRVARSGGPLAIDIETPRSVTQEPTKTKRMKKVYGPRYIACVGFADSPSFSITIPTTTSYWGSKGRLHEAWELIRELCALPNEKICQNGLFDTYWLAQPAYKSPVTNFKWDTLYMHHALDARDNHDLAYLASYYTREPYWKDDKKGEDDTGLPADIDTYWRYNGKDAAVTWEIADTLQRELTVAGRLDFYVNHYADLLGPCLRMMLAGIRRDEPAAATLRDALTAERKALLARMEAAAGESLYATKGLSTTKLKRYLYETLQLPVQFAKNASGARTATTNEVALRRLALRFPEKLGEVAECILRERRIAKLLEFVAEGRSDPDGRVRCSFMLNTEAGRLASAKNPTGSGANMQNQDVEIRSIYLPDEGHLLLKADLSQAESRVCYMLTHDPELMALARSAPWEVDTHSRNAQAIFHNSNPHAALGPGERDMGKKVSHAMQRGMKGAKLADEMLKTGIVRTPEECQRYLDALAAKDKGIFDYFTATRQHLIRDHRLVNTWGREFLAIEEAVMQRFGDDLYRKGYSFPMQSEVADTLNQWGLKPLDALLQGQAVELHGQRWPVARLGSRLLLQVHDELVVSAVPSEVFYIVSFLRWALERPRVYGGEPMTIPITFALGRTWKAEVEWKRPPTQEQVELAVVELCAKTARA
jgi:uracil-DNA glycosylase family 4